MKTSICLLVLPVAGSLLFCSSADAQNILNDTILLNTTQNVALVFPDDPNIQFSKSDGSYMSSGGKKSLLLIARKKDAETQEAYITEGNRKHRFVLMYTEGKVPLMKEWKNKKALKNYVDEKAKMATARLKEADGLYEKQQYVEAKKKYAATLNDVREQDRAAVNARMADCDIKQQAQTDQAFKMHLEKAEAYAGRNMYREADAEYKKAITIKPDNAEAKTKKQKNQKSWYGASVKKADAAMKATQKDYVTAEKELEEAKFADSAQFLADKYGPQLKTAKKEAGSQRLKQHKKRGDEAYELHLWNEARLAYEEALLIDEDDDVCKQKLKEVLKEQKEAEDKKKDEAVYYAHLDNAKKLAAAKNYDAAIAEYEKAEKIFGQRRFPKDRKEEMKKAKSTTARQ